MASTVLTSGRRRLLPSPVFEANWHVLPVLVCAALFTAPLFICTASAQVQQAWVARYTGASAFWENYATAMTVDTAGNSYITGYSMRPGVVGLSDFDYVTIKYAPGGNQVWLARYNGPLSLGGDGPNDQPSAIAVDLSGNVYVTGNSSSRNVVPEYTTVKYSSSGSQLWVSRYHAPSNSFSDAATAIGVDAVGNVYVTGHIGAPYDSQDYVTIKYAPSGSQLWSARYDSTEHGDDRPTAMFIDNSNCYVTGNSGTIKYDAQGTLLWAARGPESTALKVDPAGNVYTAGLGGIAKFDPSGNLLWQDTNTTGIALALSMGGTICVTSVSSAWPQENFITLKLDPVGKVIWRSRFSGPFNNGDTPGGIESDTSGNVFVGCAFSGDLAVVKYDPNGNLVWVARQAETNATAAAFRLDAAGDTYIAGTAFNPMSVITHDYVLAKFIQSAVSGFPIITTQPNPSIQAVPSGSDVTYVVVVTGSPPLRYQWRFDGHEIASATNATLLLTHVSLSQQGDYSVIVSNGVGWTVSPEAQLIVNMPPVFVLQPTNQMVKSGASYTLRANATGSPPLMYQWLQNGVALPGATDTLLAIAQAQRLNAGDYVLVVTNAFGAATSHVAAVTILELPPVMTIQPQDQLYVQGHVAKFSVTATGSLPLGYQWRFNGVEIPGATNTSLRLTNLEPANIGEFTIGVTNPFGSVTSAVARLCVDCLDGVVVAWGTYGSAQWDVPVGLNNAVGIAGGYGYSLALRADGVVVAWTSSYFSDYFGNINVPPQATNIVGIAAGRSHSLAVRSDGTVVGWGRNVDDSGIFVGQATVPNALSNVTTVATGRYHSLALRANGTIVAWGEDWAGKTNVPTDLSDVVAIVAGWEHSVALRADGKVVVWGWGGAGQTNVPAGLSNVVAIAAGGWHSLALRRDGTVAAWGYDSSSALTNVPVGLSNVVAIAAGERYNLALRADGTVVGWGYQTIENELPAHLHNVSMIAAGADFGLALVTDGRPSLTVHPASQTVADGDNPELIVMAAGQGVLSYQWQFNGTNLIGATNHILGLLNVQPEQAGNYHVIVGNALGSVTSKAARLTVLVRPRMERLPESTFAAVGSSVTLTANATGTPPLRYQWRKNGENIAGATNATFTITNAQISDGGSYSVVVANDVGVATSGALLLVVVPPSQVADNFANRLLLTTNLVAGTNRFATREVGEPYHAEKFGSNSVWYRWVAPSNGIASFRTVGSTFDTLLGVYTGSNVAELTAVAQDEDRGGFFTSQLRFNAQTNVEYAIAIDGFVGQQGTFILTWDLEPTIQVLPVITNAPRSQTVRAGNDVTLSVGATGEGLTYQWHFNGVAIPGANATTLALNNVQPQNVGFYTVAITNSLGRGIEGLPAAVEIGPLPAVQAQDKLEDLFGELRPPGGGAPFMAASIANTIISVPMGTIGYQITSMLDARSQSWEPSPCGMIGGASKWIEFSWLDSGTVVIDTQGSTFDTVLVVYRVVPFALLSQNVITCNMDWRAGAGWSRVSFEAERGTTNYVVVDGAKSTDRAQLNWAMGRLPQSTASPVFDLLRTGQARRFWAGFTNAIPPPRYRWLHDGQPILGATNEWLDLPALGLTNAGSYSVIASNALGEVQQLIAQLTAPMLTSEVKLVGGSYSYKLTLTPVEFPGLTMVLESSTILSTNTNDWVTVFTHTNALAPVSLDFPITTPQRFFRTRPGP